MLELRKGKVEIRRERDGGRNTERDGNEEGMNVVRHEVTSEMREMKETRHEVHERVP